MKDLSKREQSNTRITFAELQNAAIVRRIIIMHSPMPRLVFGLQEITYY